MSLASALKAVGQEIKDPEIKALIQLSLGNSRNGKGHFRSSAKALEPSGYSGVEGATAKLNEMILESEQKLDLEDVKCQMFNEEQKAIMEETRQDIAVYNAVAASARANILAAMTTIEIMGLIIDMTECSTSSSSLLQCKHHKGHARVS